MNNEKINEVLERYSKKLPLGFDFGDLTHDILSDHKENYEIKTFLKELNILEFWGNSTTKLILSNKGKELWNQFKSIDLIIEHLKKVKTDYQKIEENKNKIILLDLKLKKWQKNTYWIFFIIAILGMAGTIDNFINRRTTNQIIEKLNKELAEAKVIQKQIETLSIKIKPDTTKVK